MTAHVPTEIELDLLIVGGGIQGLTLLHHYAAQRRGRAILVSRDALGKGETLHSHGYLHRGHFLPPEQAHLIGDLVESFDWWNAWMGRNGIRYEEDAAILFDLSPDRYETTTRVWEEAGLRFEPLARLPEALRGGSYSRPDHGRRLVRIHDRLIPAWRIVEAIARPLQDRMLDGELQEISWDPGSDRITSCLVSAAGTTIRFRPQCLVLATGRETQRLLRDIRGPQGPRRLPEGIQRHRVRDVPMILIRGHSLPALSGWFHVDGPITMMSHPMGDGERMWVVTPMEGHRTVREDFEKRQAEVDEPTVRQTLRILRGMVPALRETWSELRISSYFGPKIDHPEGNPTWFVGDGGIANLRVVWPVLWGLAHSAALEVIRGLPETTAVRAAGLPASSSGIAVGDEHRLSASRSWSAL